MTDFNATVLPEFNPPGYLQDLTKDNQLLWSKNKISQWMNGEISAKNPDGTPLQGPDGIIRTPLTQFFNGTVTAYDQTANPTVIHWKAFPNKVQVAFPNDLLRWQIADSSRIFQDEYLEWSVARDSNNNIQSCTFTCEGPEYWQFVADYQPDTLVSLYNQYNGSIAGEIQLSDLMLINENTGAAVYNPANYWNFMTTTGTIAHLIHPSNTLSAEIDIAAQSTVIREKNGTIIDDEIELINCSKYGNPLRNSDPHIGIMINNLSRKGIDVTIADPVALYIYNFDTSGLQLDLSGEGTNKVDLPDGTIIWERGNYDNNQGLRLKIQIPDGVVGTGTTNKGQQLTVSDIYNGDTQILYASQFADLIQMSVSGAAITGGQPSPAQPCPCTSSQKMKEGIIHATQNSKAQAIGSRR